MAARMKRQSVGLFRHKGFCVIQISSRARDPTLSQNFSFELARASKADLVAIQAAALPSASGTSARCWRARSIIKCPLANSIHRMHAKRQVPKARDNLTMTKSFHSLFTIP